MQGKSLTCNVIEGRIRIVCPRCQKKRYVAVPAGGRKKSIRCTCGLSTMYTLNFRSTVRESTSGKAVVFLTNGRQCPVYLCDLSMGGLGFNIPPQYARALSSGQEVSVKYRALTGAMVQRKLRIKSVTSNRVGAEFLDGYRPAASW